MIKVCSGTKRVRVYHAVRDTVTDNLVDNVPRGDAAAHTLDLLLNVLRNDVVNEVAGRDTAGEPRLKCAGMNVSLSWVGRSEGTYGELLMPEGVVATEGGTASGSVRLHALASGERACAAGWLGRLPFARVLGDDVVEERVEDVRRPARLG
jgi:hypothetical protein